MAEMVCQHCGREGTSSSLGGFKCSNSPTGKHVLINAHGGKYTCQYCGREGTNSSIGGFKCSDSPTGIHVIV